MRRLLFLSLLFLLSQPHAWAQTTRPSAANTAAPEFELHEWGVFVLDVAQGKLNPDGFVSSTLPDFVDSHRQTAEDSLRNQPYPVCVMRLTGKSDAKIDIAVGRADGSFMASWPKAQIRVKQLLWRDLTLSDQPEFAAPQHVSAEHWFTALRTAPSDYLSSPDCPAERFLLYDAEIPYTFPITVKTGKDKSIEFTTARSPVIHDLTFYQPDAGGWRFARADDLAPTTTPSTTQSTTQSAIARPTLHKLNLTSSPAARPADLAAAWRSRLIARGLPESDCDLIQQILAARAFDPHRLTAVYLMDSAEYDRLLPLEVTPDPAKTVRVGIVIVTNADISSGSEIDDLIAQLGDPSWPKRTQAYDALRKLGPAALPKLQQATTNKDMEIVWRAQRLVAQLQKPQPTAP